jgi:hypothetical protein
MAPPATEAVIFNKKKKPKFIIIIGLNDKINFIISILIFVKGIWLDIASLVINLNTNFVEYNNFIAFNVIKS